MKATCKVWRVSLPGCGSQKRQMVQLHPFFRSVGDCGRHRPCCPSSPWICGWIFRHISLKTCSSKPCLTLCFLPYVSSEGLAGVSLLATGVCIPESGVGRVEAVRRWGWVCEEECPRRWEGGISPPLVTARGVSRGHVMPVLNLSCTSPLNPGLLCG